MSGGGSKNRRRSDSHRPHSSRATRNSRPPICKVPSPSGRNPPPQPHTMDSICSSMSVSRIPTSGLSGVRPGLSMTCRALRLRFRRLISSTAMTVQSTNANRVPVFNHLLLDAQWSILGDIPRWPEGLGYPSSGRESTLVVDMLASARL